MILPWAYAAPRLTTSQHATPIARASGRGRNTHLTCAPGLVRSTAIRLLGNGVTTYIVLPTTSGPPSWPRGTPVVSVPEMWSCPTLPASICASVLYRVPARSPAGVSQVAAASGAIVRTPASKPPVGGAPGAPMVDGSGADGSRPRQPSASAAARLIRTVEIRGDIARL